MGRWPTRESLYPWHLETESDLCPANHGEPELSRALQVDGRAETHLGLLVRGQKGPDIVLGLLVIRCARAAGAVTPLTLSIPDGPRVNLDTRRSTP